MKKLLYILLPILLLLSCEEILLEDDISDETVLLIAPADNAQFFSTSITFTWGAIENGTEYRIQIAKPDFNNPLQIIADSVVDTTSFTTQLGIGNYQWRVQGVNSGYETAFSTRSLTVVSNEDFQSNTVALTSPANNIITNTATQNLVWQSVLGATQYNLQILDSNNNLVDEQDVTATSVSYTFSDGSYQWRVRATNGEQNTLYSSRNILIDTTVPNTPILNTPANSGNTSDNDITFSWSRTAIAGSAETDVIYIYNNSSLTDPAVYEGEETSPYTTSTLSNGTYYWYVKAFDEAGNESQQSSVFSFTIN
ncbi:hypothetical protein E0W68_09405 [Flavobacterium salilacus subsp. salilacus]|uniref:Ig-like domain-containing protein n=1 Tax=Flavobacterium TaxID=237 RepID=UPI0010753DFC|nr:MULTISPECIES: Ig-like domain-containing protein [Flavobacterium]KAF2518528.1 hypothetical protein E0W68_09405 [Flavobacterium salilacus subsp. salilacus]MBE1615171.1 hypothetical protein [Flavobacterium sp. SaA2.13]